MLIFSCHSNQNLDAICPKTKRCCFVSPWMLHMKFDGDWPSKLKNIWSYIFVTDTTVVVAFYLATETKRKRIANETKTLHKRSFWNAFSGLTFSQWNGKYGFRLNAFFFLKSVLQNFLTFSQWNGKNHFRKHLTNQHQLIEKCLKAFSQSTSSIGKRYRSG